MCPADGCHFNYRNGLISFTTATGEDGSGLWQASRASRAESGTTPKS
jgi:hypothetical protein